MRRLGRWTLNGLTVLSLLLCVAAVAMNFSFYSEGSFHTPGNGMAWREGRVHTLEIALLPMDGLRNRTRSCK